MADLSKLNVPIGGTATTYNLKDKAVRDTLIEAQTSNKGKVWKTDATTGVPSWQSESGGTSVVPNPSGTASTELSKIGIDGTNYNIKDTTYSDATTSASGLMSASDKTKLNGIATGAEVNVQSNWTQTTTTADDYIKNKPNLATVATSGSYNDLSNKPTIPSTSNCYQSTDTAETTLADDDKVPFYDTSATSKKNTTWANLKSVLKTYFDTLYNKYTLPTASTSTLGGVKVDGTTVTINGSGVISSSSGSTVTPNPSGTATTELSKLGINGTNYNIKDTTYSAATTSAAGLMSAEDKTKLNGVATGATANTGTVTSVATGAGLTGGAITGSGTIKAKLQSETLSSLTAVTRGATAEREYPVGLDANGNLSVNVPWVGPIKRCWVYSEESSVRYFKIYEDANGDQAATPLWISGSLGKVGTLGYAYPISIAVNLKYGDIDGFVAKGYDPDDVDIILTKDASTRRVYVALKRGYTAADLLIRSPFGGGVDISPSPLTTMQGTVQSQMSNLAKLPTVKVETSVTLSISDTTTVTLSSDKIDTDSIADFYCSEWGLVPQSVSVAYHSCTIIMPVVSTAKTVTVGIFVR